MSRKHVYIIGARGAGREFVARFRDIPGFLDQYDLKGFLDDKSDALDGYRNYPPIISSVEDFVPHEGDVFACALGNPIYREKYVNMMLAKGGKFETFISPKASVYQNSRIGIGTVIYENCVVSVDVSVGDFVLMLSNVALGHDSSIGNFSVLEANASVCGFAQVGVGAVIHTTAVVLPKVRVADNSIVGAGSVVLANVRSHTTVFGMPAVRIV